MKSIFCYFVSLMLCLNFLNVSKLKAGVWEPMVIDTCSFCEFSNLHFFTDSMGLAHILYFNSFNLCYGFFNGKNWTKNVRRNMEVNFENCSMAVDRYNHLHMSFWDINKNGDYVLIYAGLKDTGWVQSTLITGSNRNFSIASERTGIEVNENGFPAISYLLFYLDFTSLFCSIFDGNQWNHIEVDRTDYSYFSKLRLDSHGMPVIAYHVLYPNQQNQTQVRLKVAYFNKDKHAFTIYELPDKICILNYRSFPQYEDLIDFDLDSKDNAYLLYVDISGNLKLATLNQKIWRIEKIAKGITFPISLKIDRQDQPAIIFTTNNMKLKYAIRKNGRWHFDLVASDRINSFYEAFLDFSPENLPQILVKGDLINQYGLFYYRYWTENPEVLIPIKTFNFDTVDVKSSEQWKIPVINLGQAPLILRKINFSKSSSSDTVFKIIKPSFPLTILPGEKQSINVRFKPALTQTYADTLFLFNNDQEDSLLKIYVKGKGIRAGN